MIELARKAWVVSLGHRQRDGQFVDYLFFFVGHPTRQSAVDALRRNLRTGIGRRLIRAEREMDAAEIILEQLRYRQVKFVMKGRAPP